MDTPGLDRPAFDKRFWVCGIVVSIAAMLLDFLVHGCCCRATTTRWSPGRDAQP